MYKWSSVLWTLCLVIGCLVGADKKEQFQGFKDSPRPRRETCSEGQYYDHVTGNCDECAPHCDRPDHSPPTPCQRFCGERVDYSSRTRRKETTRSPCETGTYNDDVTGHCDPCGPHCAQIPLNDPPLPCRNYCRDSEKSQGDQPVASESSKDLPAWAIAVIVVAILIVVAAIGAFIVMLRHKVQARQNIQLDIPEMEQIKRPVVEDTIPNELSEMVPNPSNV